MSAHPREKTRRDPGGWLRGAGAGALLVLLLACAGWPWNPKGPSQLPLGGDRECSRSPDLAVECCYAHDNDYWIGGTEQDRFTADAELLACMALYGVPEEIAVLYYRAVRAFGAPAWNLTPERTRGPPRR